MRIRNLCPHPIRVRGPQRSIVLPAEPIPARIRFAKQATLVVSECHVIRTGAIEVTGLPDPEPGTFLIVSGQLRLHCSDRADLISPQGVTQEVNGEMWCQGFVANPMPVRSATGAVS